MKKISLAALAAFVVLVAVVLAWPAGGGPVPIAHGQATCARCNMIVSEPGFAAELEDRRGRVTIYDDVGCMLLDLWDDREAFVAGWVEDHHTHELVPLGEATWVAGGSLHTPMGYGIAGLRDADAAGRLAAEHGGRVVSLGELAAMRHELTGGSPADVEPGARPFTHRDAERGKQAYLRECSACHGERGDGKGPAAAFIEPRPRDFTRAQFKLRTTPSGVAPATADVVRTIERGIPGTAMPAFTFLAEREREEIAAYVLELAGLLDTPEPQPIAAPGEPPPVTAATVARGKEIYANLYCHSCHGPAGKGDGPSAQSQRDTDGNPVAPRDFSTGVFRGGRDRADLYYRFVTGMDGSPMPSFADTVQGDDRWALVDYVLSLEDPAPPTVYSKDPIRAGRQLAAEFGCRGCHVLDDGTGGNVGPDLRVSGQKLSSEWVRSFLDAPRERGKIYPWRTHRMPDLGLTEEQAEVAARYLAAMGRRNGRPWSTPDPSTFQQEQLAAGQGIFMLRCTECHTLGDVIETPPIKQQGPDLIHVAERVDYAWASRWILDPKRIDPVTRMTNPGITPADVEAVRMFLWKTSIEQNGGRPQ